MSSSAASLAIVLLLVGANGAEATTQRYGRVVLNQTQDTFTDEIADSLVISDSTTRARFIVYFREGKLRCVLRHNIAIPGNNFDVRAMFKSMMLRVNKNEAMTISCINGNNQTACDAQDETGIAKLINELYSADQQGAVSLAVMIKETPKTKQVYDCEGVARAIDASANLKRYLWRFPGKPR